MSLESTSDHLSELKPINNMVLIEDLSLLKQMRIDRFNEGIYRKDEDERTWVYIGLSNPQVSTTTKRIKENGKSW